jgi:hypothetical protein
VAPWPGALLVVVGGGPLLDPPPTGVTRMDRLPDAFELATARPRPQHARRPLQPLLEAPSLARVFLRRTLASWDADGYGDDAMLVVDELVANAVLHAGTEIELRFALSPDRLGVVVADRSPDRPSVEHPGGAAARRRRRRIVARASAAERRQGGPRRPRRRYAAGLRRPVTAPQRSRVVPPGALS